MGWLEAGHTFGHLQLDNPAGNSEILCPCTDSDNAPVPPNFVGNDFFCEAGVNDMNPSNEFHGDDPLCMGWR